MRAPILFQVNKWRLINYSKWPIYKGKLNSPHDILYTTLLGKIQDGGFIRAFLFSFWTPVKWQSTHSRSNISMARAHKKFQRGQHSEIYLLTLKKQDKTKMELPLDMVSISAFSCRTNASIKTILCHRHFKISYCPTITEFNKTRNFYKYSLNYNWVNHLIF